MVNPRIPADVARQLGHYVYLYIHPVDGRVFYVGKGRGNRALSHLRDRKESDKVQVLVELRRQGLEPQIEILAHGLRADEALRVEAAAIDLLGVDNLTNAVRGWHEGKIGRMPLGQLIAHYRKKPVKVREPALLIRINRLYHYGMTPAELYDATRSAWKVGNKREMAELAFAVFRNIVREVYTIRHWLPAGSTFNYRWPQGRKSEGRWEFVGTQAPDKVRRRYVDRYVGDYFSRGSQNPITYVNVG